MVKIHTCYNQNEAAVQNKVQSRVDKHNVATSSIVLYCSILFSIKPE
ncbi:hypothetical protein DOY81_003971, partial [Sarcophaga bullata]